MVNRLIALNTKHFADKQKNHRGYAETQTGEQLDELLRQEWLRRDVADIRAGREEKKDWLPFICPHYTAFRDNHRAQDSIIPEAFTFMTCVDIDNPKLVRGAFEKALQVNNDELSEWHDMVLREAYSARGKGHIYIRIPKGMTIEEAQRAFCQEIGFNADELLDSSCFTPERFIYVTGIDQEIFRSTHWLEPIEGEELEERREAYLMRGLDVDGRKLQAPPSTAAGREAAKDKFPQEFKGLAYDAIVAEYWRRTGGIPSEGERNKRLHQLAANLRAICDNQEEWLLEVMPRLGLSELEMKAIVHSACKEPTKGSRIIDQIVKAMTVERDDTHLVEPNDYDGDNTPLGAQIAKLLPIGLKESLAGVPPTMHMPVLCAVLPLAAAYADQVEVCYCDGERQKLGMMSIIYGEQASGKSVCKHAVNIWKQQLDEEDALARKREDEWKERKKGRKASEKAPEDPKVLIRTVPVTVSCSTLLKRLKNSCGHTLYSFGEELDTLRKTNGAGSWSSKYDIYRLAFDPLDSEWGQDYNSDQAESGVVKVAYNWTMLGTSGAVRKCFKTDNIENGLSSRILLAEMPDTAFAKMPRYGRRSPDDEARIQQAVTRLRSCSGYIDTPRLRKAIDQWVEEKRIDALKDIDHVKDTYRRRAAVIGFRCGVIHHLLTLGDRQTATFNSKETKATVDFALMMAEYCLKQQIKTFGDVLQNQYADSLTKSQRTGANNYIFDQLPPTFTADDLAALKQGALPRNSIIKIISRWNRDGWVEKADNRRWRKVPASQKK
ncbi:MAG: hypothetical protein J6Z14_02480 [Prevotella sp.]|nr:hypothetical protein [Prevotella sp.]